MKGPTPFRDWPFIFCIWNVVRQAVGVEWNRLTATPLRLAWLSRDFDSWNGLCCLSDEDDVQVFQPDPSLGNP